MAYTGVRRTLETLNRLEWLNFWFIGVSLILSKNKNFMKKMQSLRLMIRDCIQLLELELKARDFSEDIIKSYSYAVRQQHKVHCQILIGKK